LSIFLLSIISDIDSSVVEAVAKFDENLSRVVPVESAEGDAVIDFRAAVGYVDGIQGSRKLLSKIFAKIGPTEMHVKLRCPQFESRVITAAPIYLANSSAGPGLTMWSCGETMTSVRA